MGPFWRFTHPEVRVFEYSRLNISVAKRTQKHSSAAKIARLV